MGYEPHLSAGLQLLSKAELSGCEVQHPRSQAGGWSGAAAQGDSQEHGCTLLPHQEGRRETTQPRKTGRPKVAEQGA